MGYCHYWQQETEIEETSFLRIVSDFKEMVLVLDDLGARLAGYLGEGVPEITENRIAFNGLTHCGHFKNEEISIPFPAPNASGIGSSINAIAGSYYGLGVNLRHRTCGGRCHLEPMIFERVPQRRAWASVDGFYSDSCKTGFRPYDLAVQCLLLIAKHHLDERIRVQSGGTDFHWNDPRRLCYVHLGYPVDEFHIHNNEDGLVRPESDLKHCR
jgi:hypothetical protein